MSKDEKSEVESLFGESLFDAKDHEDIQVKIGVCPTGINIYKESICVQHFVWSNISKIKYNKNRFLVKLHEKVLDNKKPITLEYKVQDHDYAKTIWDNVVEGHTAVLRATHGEEKPKKPSFRWGTTRFRNHARTQLQTVSQLFTGGTISKATSRRTQSLEEVNKENIPSEEKDTTCGDGGENNSQLSSSAVSYEIQSGKIAVSTEKTVVVEESIEELPDIEEQPKNGKVFISSKTFTLGNRTIETITYKTGIDDTAETIIEHRVTILSDTSVDHDAELDKAIAEATQMNPGMRVEKMDVRQEVST